MLFILSEGNFFKICVLSQCIVYWMHFQNISTFAYQKSYFIHFLLVFKIVKSIQCILKQKDFWLLKDFYLRNQIVFPAISIIIINTHVSLSHTFYNGLLGQGSKVQFIAIDYVTILLDWLRSNLQISLKTSCSVNFCTSSISHDMINNNLKKTLLLFDI